jgi:hypothetical protein
MPSRRSRGDATLAAHAGNGRIDINVRNREQDLEVSGNQEDQDSNAGPLAGSQNVSGDVSRMEDSPDTTSSKKSKKKKNTVRVLERELEDSRLLELQNPPKPDDEAASDQGLDESQIDRSILPTFVDENGEAVDLTKFNIDSAEGRAAAIRYLSSDPMVQWTRIHNCGDQIRDMMLGLLSTGVDQVVVDSKPKSPRKRVAPTPGSFAAMGEHYRVGSSPTEEQGLVSQLVAVYS